MLVFIDKSGDPGFKIEQGSSRYFVVALVLFEDNAEAEACDKRISLLGRELGYPEGFMFHFRDNSHKIRQAFCRRLLLMNSFILG